MEANPEMEEKIYGQNDLIKIETDDVDTKNSLTIKEEMQEGESAVFETVLLPVNDIKLESNTDTDPLRKDPLTTEQPPKSQNEAKRSKIDRSKPSTSQSNVNIQTDSIEIRSNVQYTCLKCKITMQTFDALINHCRYEPHYTDCSFCQIKHLQIDKLQLHLSSEHNYTSNGYVLRCLNDTQLLGATLSKYRPQYPCLLCTSKTFPRLNKLREHIKVVHNYCVLCCVTFRQNHHLVKHKLQHFQGEIKFFKCTQCNLEFRTLHYLSNHAKLFHRVDKVPYERTSKLNYEKETPKMYDCPYCGVYQNTSSTLLQHIKIHKVLQCKCCHNKFIILAIKTWDVPKMCTLCELNVPKSTKSLIKMPPQNLNYNSLKLDKVVKNIHDIPCLFCDYKGDSVQIYEHTADVHFICRICIQDFESEGDMLVHKELHSNGQILFHQCNFCLSHFRNHEEFLDHVESKHSKMMNYEKKFKLVNKNIPDYNEKKIKFNSQCPFCHFHVSTATLMIHLTLAHGIFQCKKCLRKQKVHNKEDFNNRICQSCGETSTEVKCTGVSSETQTVDGDINNKTGVFETVLLKHEHK